MANQLLNRKNSRTMPRSSKPPPKPNAKKKRKNRQENSSCKCSMMNGMTCLKRIKMQYLKLWNQQRIFSMIQWKLLRWH